MTPPPIPAHVRPRVLMPPTYPNQADISNAPQDPGQRREVWEAMRDTMPATVSSDRDVGPGFGIGCKNDCRSAR
jgi:hypothetical protein